MLWIIVKADTTTNQNSMVKGLRRILVFRFLRVTGSKSKSKSKLLSPKGNCICSIFRGIRMYADIFGYRLAMAEHTDISF
jgi:hypothetical protein